MKVANPMDEFRHGDYAFSRPEKWLDASNVVLVGPPDETGYSPSLMVTREDLPAKTTSKEYGAQQEESLRQALGDQEYEILSGEEVAVQGLPAFRRVHAFTPPNLGFRVQQMQTYIVKGREAFTLTATDRADRFPSSEPVLAMASDSFRLLSRKEMR